MWWAVKTLNLEKKTAVQLTICMGRSWTIASEPSIEGEKSYLWNSDAEAPKIELRDFPNTTTSVHTMWLVTVSPTQYLWFTLSCKYSSWHLLHQYLQVKVSMAIPTTGLSLHHTMELSSGQWSSAVFSFLSFVTLVQHWNFPALNIPSNPILLFFQLFLG